MSAEGFVAVLTEARASLAMLTHERHVVIERRARTWAEAHASGMSWGALARVSGVSETLVRREARVWKA